MFFDSLFALCRYCGPGTKLKKRLKRGDPGINPLDEACKRHDIAYSKFRDDENRSRADEELANEAWERVKAGDSSLGERATALAVSGIMKLKSKLGGGLKNGDKRKTETKRARKTAKKSKTGNGMSETKQNKKRKKTQKEDKKKLTFKDLVKATKEELRNSGNVGKAITVAKNLVKNSSSVETPRVIPLKRGGFLPMLLPILSGIGALAGIGGTAAQVVRTVKEAAAAKKQLEEAQRHNRSMEAIAIGKGLYLRPYKSGFGLFLNPKNYH